MGTSCARIFFVVIVAMVFGFVGSVVVVFVMLGIGVAVRTDVMSPREIVAGGNGLFACSGSSSIPGIGGSDSFAAGVESIGAAWPSETEIN